MKNIILLSSLSFLSVSATLHAQPQKGDWLAGVTLLGGPTHGSNFGYTPRMNLAPRASYFITNRLSVGLSTGFSFARGPEKSYVLSYDVSPFMRYYFSRKEGIRLHRPVLFTELSAGVGGHKIVDKTNQFSSSYNNRSANVGIGVAYYVNKYVSVEGMATLGKPRYNIGINVLVPGRKKKDANVK